MQTGFTLWFTGLSCAGKTTISQLVEKDLRSRSLKVEILDGDIVRTNLSKGLGFTREDRDANILRIGFVSKLLSRNGVIVIVAAISPYREARDKVRNEIGNFIEVFVNAPLDECIRRDVKGLYKKAIAGEIKHYTGIDDPYEEPEHPEITVNTAEETAEESALKVVRTLEEFGFITPSGKPAAAAVYSEKEEEEVRKRLESLGYLE